MFRQKKIQTLIVDYVDEGKRVTSLYNSSALKEKDKYTVFLGGNYSLLDIRTVSTSTGETI